MANNIPDVTLRDVTLMFRNFSGKEDKFNREGDRNFVIFLNDEDAGQLGEMGLNIKELAPRDEGDSPQKYVKVKVSYKVREPSIVMINARGRTNLDQESLSLLDWAEITKADVILNLSPWEMNGKEGVTAYLRTGFFTIYENPLELEYAGYEDEPSSARTGIEYTENVEESE